MVGLISGRRERGTSGWTDDCARVVCFRAWSKLASMCLRERRAETGLSFSSCTALFGGGEEGGREGEREGEGEGGRKGGREGGREGERKRGREGSWGRGSEYVRE